MDVRYLFALLLLLPLTTWGQADLEKKMRSALEIYYGYNQEGNVDGILDMLHPKLYELAGRDMLKTTMEQTFNGEEFSFTLRKMTTREVHGFYEEESGDYALVDYSATMRMQYLQPDSASYAMMADFMIGKYGAENVDKDVEAQSISAKMTNQLWAYSPKGSEDWFFLENNTENPALLDAIIPAEVQAHYAGGKD